MTEVTLEHVNVTVTDPKKTAARLCELFNWRIRWEGEAKDGGYSVHVGGETSYLALYTPAAAPKSRITSEDGSSYRTHSGLNHIAVTVDNLDSMASHVESFGYSLNHPEPYDPGRRFYFYNEDGVEFEIVSYQ